MPLEFDLDTLRILKVVDDDLACLLGTHTDCVTICAERNR